MIGENEVRGTLARIGRDQPIVTTPLGSAALAGSTRRR